MNSFIGWVGGKRLLRKEVLKRFPHDFSRYIIENNGGEWDEWRKI